jgi:hypothetical protein
MNFNHDFGASEGLESGHTDQGWHQVLVLNAGSSSLKWTVLDARTEALVTAASTSWEGTEGGRHHAVRRSKELLGALPLVLSEGDAA